MQKEEPHLLFKKKSKKHISNINVGIVLGSCVIVLVSFWDRLGVMLVSSSGNFGIVFGVVLILGSLWNHFGVVLGSLWDRFGIVLV